ncbi:MAG TPA: hypothetical protein VHC21_00675 [Candidatus Saccharimonadales bacterium]|nr:hypothetical protein [Candidatus Saccharimonadales bacterium]
MAEAAEILSSITFDPGVEQVYPEYSRALGYAYIELEARNDQPWMAFIGFTGQRQKSISVGDGDIRSVTRLEQLQDEERTIKMQARGVGTRMYNTVEALLGTGEGDNIAAYTFQIDPDKILDRRRSGDGTTAGRLWQAARQVGKIAQAQVMGLEATVDSIHESFGKPEDVDAVLYNQSAKMELQQRQQGGVEQPAGIPPEFMVIRNPHIIMRKIGEYRP